MSYQQERRFVLDMLETGKINLDQATQLLDLLSVPQPANTVTNVEHKSSNKVVLEIDADRNNIQKVLEKLNQAFNRL